MDKKHFANKLDKNASEDSRLLGSRREQKIGSLQRGERC